MVAPYDIPPVCTAAYIPRHVLVPLNSTGRRAIRRRRSHRHHDQAFTRNRSEVSCFRTSRRAPSYSKTHGFSERIHGRSTLRECDSAASQPVPVPSFVSRKMNDYRRPIRGRRL